VEAPAEVCLLNIGPRERTKRMRFGGISLAIALLALAGLTVSGVSPWWSVLLFLPFAGATSGYFQAKRKT
jgi:fatty acid desaturase